MAEPATEAELRKTLGKKVTIPVPEGMIPVRAPLVDGTATVAVPGGAALAAPGDLERLRESMAAQEPELVMSTLVDPLAVVRLTPFSAIPEWANHSTFCSITRTADELSIVTCSFDVPATEQREGPFTAFMVHGPLDFALTGILSRIATALARAGVSIFAISTYDTDYVLVPSADAERARSALTASGTCRFTDP